MRLQTNQDNFGLIRKITNGGVIKNLTIENSTMNITASRIIFNLGFFVGRASTSNTPEAGTGNITISDCHSINNTITITGNDVGYVGFIAGHLINNLQSGPYILVNDCSTKYSNFTSSAQYTTKSIGGNIGYAGINFFSIFSFFLLLFLQNRILCFIN